MDALILTLFVSLILVGAGAILLVKLVRGGDFDHGDRLSLLPLDEDDPDTGSRVRNREGSAHVRG
jgi:hypothetical protein